MKIEQSKTQKVDVLIVGAGPAGLGCATTLKLLGVEDVVILDRSEVGASFLKWPEQMRFITPSFYSNPYGQPDLNAITPDTSPGLLYRKEHLSGREYAGYLKACARHYGLNVLAPFEVISLEHLTDGFRVATEKQNWHSRFVIWAAGEFGFPRDEPFPGSSLCLHNTKVRSWDSVEGLEAAVIGGAESGMDAAVNLAARGKNVHVFSRGEPWSNDDNDPSRSLSFHTFERLRHSLLADKNRIQFHGNSDVLSVSKRGGVYRLEIRGQKSFDVSAPPILATGFQSGFGVIDELFEWHGGRPCLSEASDESTLTPDLFYSGPQLQHRNSLFCYIYKFRSRFGIIAQTIAGRLGVEADGRNLEHLKRLGFLIEDLSCCTDCRCAVEEVPDSDTMEPLARF